MATNRGARKAVTVPDKANRPKNCVINVGGEILAMSVLDDDKPVTKNMAKICMVQKYMSSGID